MTREEIEQKIDSAVRKRDYAADELGKPALSLTYQQEIDRLVQHLERLPDQPGDSRGS